MTETLSWNPCLDQAIPLAVHLAGTPTGHVILKAYIR